MPTLHFKGKTFVQNRDLVVKYEESVPNKKISFTEPVPRKDRLFIKSDNTTAMKALLPGCAGKVKCIYIDPPN